jgi:hypothetical protein
LAIGISLRTHTPSREKSGHMPTYRLASAGALRTKSRPRKHSGERHPHGGACDNRAALTLVPECATRPYSSRAGRSPRSLMLTGSRAHTIRVIRTRHLSFRRGAPHTGVDVSLSVRGASWARRDLTSAPSSSLEGVQSRLRARHVLFDRATADADAPHDFVANFDR